MRNLARYSDHAPRTSRSDFSEHSPLLRKVERRTIDAEWLVGKLQPMWADRGLSGVDGANAVIKGH